MKKIISVLFFVILIAITGSSTRVFVFVGPCVVSVLVLYFVYVFSSTKDSFLILSYPLSMAMFVGFVIGLLSNFTWYFSKHPDFLFMIIFLYGIILIYENLVCIQIIKEKRGSYDN